MNKKLRITLVTVGCMSWLGLSGCSNTLKESASGMTDPTERGLMYVATAMVLSAIIRGVMNK